MGSAACRCLNTKAVVQSDRAMVINRVQKTNGKHGRLYRDIVLASEQLRECSFLKISVRRNRLAGQRRRPAAARGMEDECVGLSAALGVEDEHLAASSVN